MLYPKDRNIHRPSHIYLGQSTYFVTTKTFNKAKFFNGNQRKEIFQKVLQQSIRRFRIKLFAWVLLDNHYHLLFWLPNGNDLAKFFQNLHTNSSRLLNAFDHKRGRKIWYQYLDHCLRSEKDFYVHFNYIHHNPVKHGYVKSNGEYNFSSYNFYKNKYGIDFLLDIEEKYPTIDFTDFNEI